MITTIDTTPELVEITCPAWRTRTSEDHQKHLEDEIPNGVHRNILATPDAELILTQATQYDGTPTEPLVFSVAADGLTLDEANRLVAQMQNLIALAESS